MKKNVVRIVTAKKISFHVKYGWNGDLSMLGLILIGLDDPVICRAIKWRITINIKMNGRRKCSIKNRERVA